MTQNFNVQVKNNSNSEIEYSDNIDCVNVKSGIKSILSQNKHLKTGDYTIYLTNDNQKYRYYTSNHNNSQMTEDHSGKQLYNINVMTGGSNVVDVSYPKLIRARNSDNAVKQLVKIIPKFQNDNYKIDVKQIGGLFDNSFIHGQPIAHDLQIRSSKSNSQSYNSNINYYPHAMYEGNPIQQIQSLNTLTKGSSGKNNKKQTIPHGVMPGSVMPYGSMPYMSMPFNMVAPLHFDVKKTDDLVFITGQFAKDIIDEISIIINTFLALPTISVNSSTIERIIKLWLIGKYLQQIPDEITLFKVFLNMPDSEKFMEKLELYIVSPDFSKMVEISKKQFDKWEKDSSSNNLNDKDVFLNFMKSEIQYLEHQTGGSSDINSRLNKGDFILLFRFENFISDENQKVLKNSTITDPVLNNEKNKTVAPKYVKAIADEITANRVVSMMIKTNLTSNIRDIIQHANTQKLFEDNKYNPDNGKGDIYSQQVGGSGRTGSLGRRGSLRAMKRGFDSFVQNANESKWPATLRLNKRKSSVSEQTELDQSDDIRVLGEYRIARDGNGNITFKGEKPQWEKIIGSGGGGHFYIYHHNNRWYVAFSNGTDLLQSEEGLDVTNMVADDVWTIISSGDKRQPQQPAAAPQPTAAPQAAPAKAAAPPPPPPRPQQSIYTVVSSAKKALKVKIIGSDPIKFNPPPEAHSVLTSNESLDEDLSSLISKIDEDNIDNTANTFKLLKIALDKIKDRPVNDSISTTQMSHKDLKKILNDSSVEVETIEEVGTIIHLVVKLYKSRNPTERDIITDFLKRISIKLKEKREEEEDSSEEY